jgi:hypothetical protein
VVGADKVEAGMMWLLFYNARIVLLALVPHVRDIRDVRERYVQHLFLSTVRTRGVFVQPLVRTLKLSCNLLHTTARDTGTTR